jgi:hypothetical protein
MLKSSKSFSTCQNIEVLWIITAGWIVSHGGLRIHTRVILITKMMETLSSRVDCSIIEEPCAHGGQRRCTTPFLSSRITLFGCRRVNLTVL